MGGGEHTPSWARPTHAGRRTIDWQGHGGRESGSELLFAWFDDGDVEFPSANPDVRIHLAEPDNRYRGDVVDRIGVLVIRRRMFDLVDGWGGRHPFDKPIVVVTHSVPGDWIAAHPDAPFTFVTDGSRPASSRRGRWPAIGTSR